MQHIKKKAQKKNTKKKAQKMEFSAVLIHKSGFAKALVNANKKPIQKILKIALHLVIHDSTLKTVPC